MNDKIWRPMRRAVCGFLSAAIAASMCAAAAEGAVNLTKRSTIAFQSTDNSHPFLHKAEALTTMDLASDTAWNLTIDGEASTKRAIKVPAGGWNSDRQEPRLDRKTDVKDYVEYTRAITIPQYTKGEAVKLLFGAVNFGAEIYLNDQLITQHHGPMMPFEADITSYVEPQGTYNLRVKAYTNAGYEGQIPLGFDYVTDATQERPNDWLRDKFSYGITKYVQLGIYAPVHIEDVFVKTSVAQKTLTYTVTLRNTTNSNKTLRLDGKLSSWNGDGFQYPSINGVSVIVPAQASKTVTVGPIAWELGEESYWWPNIPFKEDYRAKLHNLEVNVSENGQSLDKQTERFGFREVAEGPYYYTINGVRMNVVGDGTPESAMSEYDCYSLSPAFLPPTDTTDGCPETWKRYMRLGINANRTHQATPTEYMMDTADELGFMLIPETGIRGSAFKQTWSELMGQSVRELARMTRNHPSVVWYSLSNEWGTETRLIDEIVKEDDTRPLVFETNTNGVGQTSSPVSGKHATHIMHYSDYPKPARQLTGMGEFAWKTDGIAEFTSQGKDMRLNDIAYFAPWDFINYWPNFLEGMSHDQHAWIQNNNPDRTDGVDGWNSPVSEHLEKSFSPFLIMDTQLERLNRTSASYPDVVPIYKKNTEIRRTLEIFNGALSGNKITLEWEARWDSADGELIDSGRMADIEIEPGFHTTKTISFTPPEPPQEERNVYFVYRTIKDGETVFTEDRLYVTVSDNENLTSVRFKGTDLESKGDWIGKRGDEGAIVFGTTQNTAPSYAEMSDVSGSEYTWEDQSSDPSALQYPYNDGDLGYRRIKAAKYALAGDARVSFTLNTGERYANVSVYLLDPDRGGRQEKIVLRDIKTDRVLDEREVLDFKDGVWLTWRVRGNVRFEIEYLLGDNTTLSGIFFTSTPEGDAAIKVEDAIDQLPSVEMVTLDNAAKVYEIRDALAALPSDKQELVVNRDKLNELIAEIKRLEDEQPGDKTVLEELIASYAGLVETDYTVDSWASYAEILTAAQTLIQNEVITKKQVDDMVTALTAAKEGLKPAEPAPPEVNKDALKALLASYADLAEADFTAESWAAYAAKLAEANALVTNDTATQTQVDDMVTALTAAKTALVEKPEPPKADMTALKALIASYAGLAEADFTAESWKAYADKLTEANALVSNENATQTQVNQMVTALTAAKNALVEKSEEPNPPTVDKNKLTAAIQTAEKLTSNAYTSESWQVFDAVYKLAKAIAGDPNVSQAVVDAQIAALEAAKASLKPAQPEPKPQPKTGWQQKGNRWYFIESSGKTVTGWKKLGKWYYFGSDGAMKTGWFEANGKWYFAESSGAMVTGWKKLGKWYYFGSDGAMKTGWFEANGKWYFAEGSGAMVTGWKKLGKWYYFGTDGKLVSSTTRRINGKAYRFNANGVCLNP